MIPFLSFVLSDVENFLCLIIIRERISFCIVSLSSSQGVNRKKKGRKIKRLASNCYHSTLYYCSTKLWKRRRRYYIFRAKRAWHVAHFYFPRIRAALRREAGKAQCIYIYYTYVQHRTTTGDNTFKTRGTFVLTLIKQLFDSNSIS